MVVGGEIIDGANWWFSRYSDSPFTNKRRTPHYTVKTDK